MPRLRLIRVDREGKIESLRAQSDTVDADGYSAFPVVTSGSAWYADGVAQTWSFTTDQNNVIDVSTYVYYLQLIEEVGTDDPSISPSSADGSVIRERKNDVVYVFETTIPTYNGDPNPVAGGPTIANGDPVLVVSQPHLPFNNDVDNGLWSVDTAGGAFWPRRGDLTVPSDFTPNFIVFDKNRSCFWECVSPKYGQTIRLDQLTGAFVSSPTSLTFQRRVPRGNIYHSITCTFDQITDMRPQ
jgi:hypothetical protein